MGASCVLPSVTLSKSNSVQISEKLLHKSDSKLHTYLVQGIQNMSEIEIKITLFEGRAKQSQKSGVRWGRLGVLFI